MITEKQLKIFGIFAKNTFKEYTYKEIKQLIRENSNSVVQNSIKNFLKEELIRERSIGTSKLYSINHKNRKVYAYLDIYVQEHLPKLVQDVIRDLREELDIHTVFYSIVIFGSYAVNKQTDKSDLDIAVFFEETNKKNIIEAVLETIHRRSLIEIHGYAISKRDFLEMLKDRYENLGKQIVRKHLIVHNSNIFYSLLREGLKNGFNL